MGKAWDLLLRNKVRSIYHTRQMVFLTHEGVVAFSRYQLVTKTSYIALIIFLSGAWARVRYHMSYIIRPGPARPSRHSSFDFRRTYVHMFCALTGHQIPVYGWQLSPRNDVKRTYSKHVTRGREDLPSPPQRHSDAREAVNASRVGLHASAPRESLLSSFGSPISAIFSSVSCPIFGRLFIS